jgi:glycosyltransferase involved in cell wall biosynthesis
MKILFLTVMPAPYQRELFAAANRLYNFRVEVRYFTSMSHDRAWDEPILSSAEVVMPGKTLRQLGASAHWNHSVVSEIKSSQADLVVVSDYSAPTAQLAMRYLALTGRPFLFWGEVPGFSSRGRLGSWIRARLQAPLRHSAGIAAIGEGAVQAYQALFPGKPVFNIPYFCDLTRFRMADQARPPRRSDDVTILFSGQLIDRKGVDVLLAAFVAAARQNTRLRVKLLGAGPERARYEAMVPEDLSHRVTFVGHKGPEHLPDEFARADVFCLPSRHDGWGVVVNEALGAGLPIIVSNAVGAGRDLVRHGVNGFITPSEDVAALADAFLRLAADDALRAQMGQESRDMATSWGIDEGVRRWRHAASTILEAGSAS